MSKKGLFLFGFVLCLSAQSKEIDFDTLEVSAKEIKSEDKSFVTPGAVSSRSGVGKSTQSIDSIIRSMQEATPIPIKLKAQFRLISAEWLVLTGLTLWLMELLRHFLEHRSIMENIMKETEIWGLHLLGLW